jgi:SpoIVB peptidase S55
MRRPWLVAAAGVLLCVPLLSGEDRPKIFPLSEIRPGLKGVGRTVFEGDKIEEFQVEILGVLRSAIAPKQDLILARLSGGPLEKTGVIAGMSGSPVYIEGKLVGAVAIAFPFSKEPIAGVTPIQQMLRVVPGAKLEATDAEAWEESEVTSDRNTGASEAARSAPPASQMPGHAISSAYKIARVGIGPGEVERLIPDPAQGDGASWKKLLPSGIGSNTFSELSLPLRFGGFSSQVIETYTPVFQALGFAPLAGGILSGGPPPDHPGNEPPITGKDIEPGSMISLFLVRGDLNLNADCTVTYVEGNNVYACGHRLLLAGPSQIPFGRAHVLGVIPSIASSFKVDAPGPAVGTIRQDRFSAIYGVVGAQAASIPVHLDLNSTLNTRADYNFEIVQDPFLSPFLVNIALLSTLGATERMVGPSTFEVKGKILLSNGDSVQIEDVNSSDVNAANALGLAVANPLTFILSSGFPDLHVKGIDLSILSLDVLHIADLEEAWSTKSEVHPGDHVEITAVLRTASGGNVIRKIPVEIPESINDKTLTVVVGSGSTINALQSGLAVLSSPPRDVRQLVRALNRMRRNNRLYALLMSPQRSFVLQGNEYPSPPPSLLQTLLADPAVPGNLTFSGSSVVGDFETKPAPYTIRGQKTILLKVVSGKKLG